MIGRFESRYPFIRSAKQFAADNNIELDALLTSDGFEDARARGVRRVEDAIKNSEIRYTPLRNDIEATMEVMSYPYARILVSAIDDKFLTKRYALAEAVRMNKLLGQDTYSTVIQIADELEIRARSVLSDDNEHLLEMHFSDYLKLSTRIKSTEWKLVNTEIRKGYVRLQQGKFDRVMQNALQDRIESELPMELPDEIKKLVKKDVDYLKNVLNENKSNFNTSFTGELVPEILPPCIRTLLANAQNGINLSHVGRFSITSFLHAIGMDSQQIIAVFSKSPDFDESKSLYQIKNICGETGREGGYTPPSCETMKTNGICYNPDELCARDTLNHPLTYFRIKSSKKLPPKPAENPEKK